MRLDNALGTVEDARVRLCRMAEQQLARLTTDVENGKEGAVELFWKHVVRTNKFLDKANIAAM